MQMSDVEVRDFYTPFVEELFFQGFRYLGAGAFRTVYRRKNFVVKVPRKTDGVVDNQMEARAYKVYGRRPTSLGLLLAPCQLLANHCLVMRYAKPVEYTEKLPEWTDHVEGAQVGRYNNKLVAFDYALDLTERYAWEKESILQSNFFKNVWKDVKPFLYPAETFPEDKDVIPPSLPIGKLVCAHHP